MNRPDVDLVVSMYERTYRDVLKPGRFTAIREENLRPFARCVAVINNVDDRDDACSRARDMVAAGEIDAFYFVQDHIDEALDECGLTWSDLGGAPHFTDWALVAVTLPGADWIVVWDAEVRLRHSHDWISPSIELMERDRRVIAANPAWGMDDDLMRHTCEESDPFALGYGFSDQVFLARRSELSQPIYGDRTLARLRFPLAHVGDVFEARIDSHIRASGRLRATYRPTTYLHDSTHSGSAYPRRSLRETLLYARNRSVVGLLRRLPSAWRPATLKHL